MDFLGILVTIARGIHLGALISAFGVLVFYVLVLRGAGREMPPPLSRLLVWSLYAALTASLPWLLLQTALSSGAGSVGELATAVPLVVASTTFGQTFLLRAVTLVAAIIVLNWRPPHWARALLLLLLISLALQSGFSHAIAQGDWTLLATHALHVVAAGAWLGALLPLWLVLKIVPAPGAGALLVRFSYLGLMCVAALLATAYVQFFGMIGGIAPLFGTSYGHLAILKGIILFGLLLCAALNRLVWTPQQSNTSGAISRGLQRTIAAELAIGIAMVAAASSLASTPPALHEQPNWPFGVQLDIAGLYYPPMWDKLERSAAAILAAFLLVIIGFLAKRFAWVPFVAASALLLAAPIPKTDILFKPAHPKTFYVSPSIFPVASIAKGAEIYEASCASCHEPKPRGTPEFSPGMPVIPPRLNTTRSARLRDGDLFWTIEHGVDDPRGGKSMQGFGSEISEGDIWSLIDYLRAKAAPARGQTVREVRAPAFNASCADGETMSSLAMRGQVVRLLVTSDKYKPTLPPAPIETRTIILPTEDSPAAGLCAIQEVEARAAYALIADVAPEQLAGTLFLIDANGWLRYVFRPGEIPQAGIDSAITEIHKAPLTRPSTQHDH